MEKLIIEFETVELKDEFLSWMSDGGGEQEFNKGEFQGDFEYIGQDKIIITKYN